MRTWMAAALGLALAIPAKGQIAPPPGAPLDPEPGAELVVYLVTMGEGDLVYERFGHNAIWVHDPVSATDNTYNWGLFDDDQPGFLRNFLRGRMWYRMDALDARHTVNAYVRLNRSVWIQELELTPRQRRELVEFVEWNRRPENQFYRYDYYRDNCSTRVRDALDRVLNGQIREQTAHVPASATFRFHTRRVTAIDPLLYTGLTIGLGPAVDRPISVWEEMFLPLSMRETVRDLRVVDAEGRERPLVRDEQTLFAADRPPLPDAPPRWWPGYLLIGLIVASLVLGLGHFAGRNLAARTALAGLGAAWLLLAGVLGLILAGLWGLTDHAAAYRNENLFLFSPLALPLAVLFPWLVLRPGRADRWAVGLVLAVAALSVAGVLFKPVPWSTQVNGDLFALVLPVHLALAAVAVLLIRGRLGRVRTPGGPRE